MIQQTLLDTLHIFRPDSATNTKIYYFETVKMIEQSKTFIDYCVDWMIGI
jgi:hypothetical protein